MSESKFIEVQHIHRTLAAFNRVRPFFYPTIQLFPNSRQRIAGLAAIP
jgi:hypothetical protein